MVNLPEFIPLKKIYFPPCSVVYGVFSNRVASPSYRWLSKAMAIVCIDLWVSRIPLKSYSRGGILYLAQDFIFGGIWFLGV